MAHDHTHAPSRESDRRLLLGALCLILAFMVGEVVVGLLVDSLALLADAGHMLTDAAAIALALIAMRLAARPASGAYTYGLKRAEILSAQINGLTLAVLVVVFVVEGVRRLLDPPDVDGAAVAVVAAVGIVVNLAAAGLLARADRRSLNIAGAFWHIVTDLFAFIATLVAGLVIYLTGWTQADAVAALVVAALMAVAAYRLLRDSARIFLEASPRGIEPGAVEAGHPGRARGHRTCTSCTSGRSPPASPRSPPTCSSTPPPTATNAGWRSRRCSASGSPSTTRRSRSTIATTCYPSEDAPLRRRRIGAPQRAINASLLAS